MIIKISGLAIICAVCALILRKLNTGLSVGVTLVGSVIIISAAFLGAQEIFSTISEISESQDSIRYVRIMLKALGVAVMTHISSGICRDCGESSIASSLEIVGKLEILMLCISPIKEILSYILKIVSFV